MIERVGMPWEVTIGSFVDVDDGVLLQSKTLVIDAAEAGRCARLLREDSAPPKWSPCRGLGEFLILDPLGARWFCESCFRAVAK